MLNRISVRQQYLKSFSVLDMTLNYTWWWGFSLGVLEMCCTPSLPLLSCLLWPKMVVPIRIPFMGLIKQFNILLGITFKLFVLNSNTWNHLILHKQMSSGSFKNELTLKLFSCKSHKYKQNLALNSAHFICNKTQPN